MAVDASRSRWALKRQGTSSRIRLRRIAIVTASTGPLLIQRRALQCRLHRRAQPSPMAGPGLASPSASCCLLLSASTQGTPRSPLPTAFPPPAPPPTRLPPSPFAAREATAARPHKRVCDLGYDRCWDASPSPHRHPRARLLKTPICDMPIRALLVLDRPLLSRPHLAAAQPLSFRHLRIKAFAALLNGDGELRRNLRPALRLRQAGEPLLAELDLAPHLLGSHPVAGSWDPCKALPMERAAAAVWELSCVVPSQHETLDFKFVLKPIDNSSHCIVEEGPNRSFGHGVTEVEMRTALFIINEKEDLECKIWVETEMLSPFDLAASWRAQQGYLQPSRVRGTHDAVMNAGLGSRAKNGFASGLELDLEKYVVPTPNMGSGVVYAANLTENPRSLVHTGSSSNNDTTKDILHNSIKGDASPDDYANIVKDVTVGHAPSLDEQRAIFVDRGVGSPKFARSTNEIFSMSNIKLDSEAKDMPAAEGAVAAAAVADQMYGPKEDRKLTIVLVGLPARGKTFTAAKLTRYLRWLGHETKHFNVGKYRRLKHGTNQTADFFRGDNKEGVEARNEVAALAMEDMLSWMQEGGQVGIFDATNSTRGRRNMLMKMAEGKCKIIFLETICKDPDVLERNIRLKVQQSPDYAEQSDFEAGVRDFKERLAYYEKVYEPVEEGSYIKMIDMVSGSGGQLQVNDISGYLPGRIVFFLVNCHLTPRPILLTRHGESLDNVRGRIGGDSSLSEAGELYSRKLASFVEKRLKSERTASIWTSTLQRTILTAHPIIGFPKIQWRALDEINAGVCDGMTYDEIKKNKPDEYESRKKDKLRYRYPRGESYLDVIQRLEPVIIELERQRAPVVVISHQAVLRALYAYFADKPLEEVPNIEVPLHTIIEIQMGVAGVQEKRYKLMDAVHPTAGL